jgi:hypothetical protein
MQNEPSEWIDAVIVTLAEVRAALACFGVHDRALEANLDHALDLACALKWDAAWP